MENTDETVSLISASKVQGTNVYNTDGDSLGARTAPLLFGGAPPPAITCDALRTFTRPTLVTHGEKTHAYYKLINEGVSKCVPGAQQVSFPNLVHNAPSANPAAFSSSLFEFISKRSGL